jgi:hypothetical protein
MRKKSLAMELALHNEEYLNGELVLIWSALINCVERIN